MAVSNAVTDTNTDSSMNQMFPKRSKVRRAIRARRGMKRTSPAKTAKIPTGTPQVSQTPLKLRVAKR